MRSCKRVKELLKDDVPRFLVVAVLPPDSNPTERLRPRLRTCIFSLTVTAIQTSPNLTYNFSKSQWSQGV